MKTLLLIPIFLLSIIHPSQAQNDSIVIKKVYRTWIIPTERVRIKQGILFEVKDSSLLISNKYTQKAYDRGKFNVLKVDARSIDVVKIRKKGNILSGALIGSFSGLIVGGMIGILQNANSGKLEENFRSIVFTAVGTGLGFCMGMIIGGIQINIPIKGTQTQFDQNKSRLNGYSIKQNPAYGVIYSKTLLKLRDTLIDIDGNGYHTLTLGGQVWMTENLKVTRYRDGSEIPDVTDNASRVGRQYNWFAVNHEVNLCPSGWHVPSLTEWTSLLNSLGGEIRTGNKLEKDFSNKWKESQWWSSTEQDTLHSQSLYLNNETIGVMFTSSAKTDRLSVRCIRDY